MDRIRLALWPTGLALATVAEVVTYDGDPVVTGADALAGAAMLACGLVAWQQRPESRAGAILTAGGFAWFLGTLAGWAIYLHRGALAHLALSYPAGRMRSRFEWAAVGAAYVYAAVQPLAGSEQATIVFSLALVALSAHRVALSGGPERRARAGACAAAVAFGLVLALGAVTQLANADSDRAVLLAYDAVVCLMAVGLSAALLRARWAQATVTGLVVDLGEPAPASALRNTLARALGDPDLAVGYWLPEERRYVDEAGRPLELPASGSGRVVTRIGESGRPVAALVHDAAVLQDRMLAAAVGSATRLAVSNARLLAEVRGRVTEVEASRRRIVEVEAEQRRALEQELHEGAHRRLERVAELVSDIDTDLERQLQEAQAELREFARGIHPAALTDGGLAAALAELAAASPVPVQLDTLEGRLPPPVEATAYFVCSEALANTAKYAGASRARVRAVLDETHLRVEVSDDGVGGADPAGGSGIRGLVDRVESLGGRLSVESTRTAGTTVVADLPLAPMGRQHRAVRR